MPIDVTPTTPKPSHHLSITAGATTFGLIAVNGRGEFDANAILRTPIQRTTLKLSQGSTQYSDFSEPFTPITQNDWSGGFGQEDFERDRTRFYSSSRLNTWMPGRVVSGPEETYGTGFRNADVSEHPNNWTPTTLGEVGEEIRLGTSFSASASYNADKVYIPFRFDGAAGTLTMTLNSDSSGSPGAVLETVTKTTSNLEHEDFWQWVEFDWSGTRALVSGTTYWIVVYGAEPGVSDAEWNVGTDSVGTSKSSSNSGSSWSAADKSDIIFRIVDTDDDRESLFYEYKGAMYFVTKPTDNSAAQVWINGDRGTADSNSGALGTLEDATKSWTTNEWAGSVVVLVDGTGSDEPTPFRVISSNDSNTLTISPDWNTTHDTTTDYVIIAANSFIERTGHGLTVPVQDVLVSKEVIYYAQGENTNMRRHREYNNSGTFTITDYAADGTNRAKFLEQVEDPVDGQQVWKANTPGTGDQSVARGNSQAWGNDITFGTAIPVGDRDDKITGLERYGSPENLWVMKQGSVWAVQNDIPDAIPLREADSVRSEKNGRAHLVHGVYLYFSLLHSLERYFRNNLDDVGPSQDAGMPADSQGPIVDMVGYPGVFFVAIDGGTANYSSILLYNQLGWHNIYRAPVKGKRIRNLYFQVIPGTTIDRLWYSEGTDVGWLPFPSDTLDPYRDSNYKYTTEGWLTTSWFYANLQDVQKVFKSIAMFTENVDDAGAQMFVEYQTDNVDETDLTSWTRTPTNEFGTSPVEEHALSSTYVLNGRRIRFRIILRSQSDSGDDAKQTTKVKAMVLDSLPRIATRYSITLSFLAKDRGKDLNGTDENYSTVETLTDQLETWANSTTVLTLRSVFSPHDNKYVVIDPNSLRPSYFTPGEVEGHIGNVSFVEIADV